MAAFWEPGSSLEAEASQTQEPGTAAYAGDFGFKVLTSSDPAEKTKKLNLGLLMGFCAAGCFLGFLPPD